MTEQEVPLSGGNITGVIRAGSTVRRATGPWSAAVHGLLQHLEARGFEGAPRFLGLDEQGREILTFIEGEMSNYPFPDYMWSDENLMEVARFLRRYHDATLDYVPPAGTIWQLPYPDSRQHEVICHNDVAPYNMVYRNGKPYGLIDFDTAGPGPRLWDLAYAVYRFVPLSYDSGIQSLGLEKPEQQSRRLKLFCTAYGMQQSYADLLDAVERRLEAMYTLLIERAAAHDPAYERLVNDGHADYYRREIASLQHHRPELQHHLSL